MVTLAPPVHATIGYRRPEVNAKVRIHPLGCRGASSQAAVIGWEIKAEILCPERETERLPDESVGASERKGDLCCLTLWW